MTRPNIPARPSVYKGVRMRSRLEADYASALDRDGETWEYEPTCFAGPDGQWLPDFRVGCDGVYTEIKPAYLIEWDTRDLADVYDRIDKILKRMTVAWLSEPKANLRLVFWTYGVKQAEAPLAILGSPNPPVWFAYTPGTFDLPLLWPGMEQTAAATKASEAEDGRS